MTDDDERRSGESWHDSQAAVVAGGLAALVLLGLLLYGVMRVARDSTDRPPQVVYPSTSVATTPASRLKTPTSTSYPMPSVQTSQETTPPVTGPPTDSPSEDPGDSGDSGVTQDTPTTIYNPYTTTTTANAGHI
ncbi:MULTISPECIES: hypothetical protein [unclassified Mycobacterium]|uniref:hypothetical protein n=1 Tax=unclassified Mycobacterium TaxID=2642494 RepID=UPI0029C618BC|nr:MULTISPECIES: hypothetical protein [unclassified Mycobacterium]